MVGGVVGLALLATFATGRYEGRLADGELAAPAHNDGYHLAYLVGAGLSLVAIAVALYVPVLRARARNGARARRASRPPRLRRA